MSRVFRLYVAAVLLLVAAAVCTEQLSPHYDTIVVGLGAAGATAASELAHAGRRVLALEAQGRVGGRVWTTHFGDGVVELGAEWIHGTEGSRVAAAAAACGVRLGQQAEAAVRRAGGRAATAAERELLARGLQYVTEGADTTISVADHVTDRLLEYVRDQRPQLPGAGSLRDVLHFLDLSVRVLEGCSSCGRYSFQKQVNAHSPYEVLAGSEYTSWGRIGYETFFDVILNKYNNGSGMPTLDMKLNTEVTSISWTPEAETVTVTAGGRNYTADSVIVTVSLGVLKERHAALFSPSLPADKVAAIETMSMGNVGKIVLSFERAWWGAEQALYFLWSAEVAAAVPRNQRWLTTISEASMSLGSSNTLTLWTTGDTATLVETLPEHEVLAGAMLLLRLFSCVGVVTEPTGLLRTTWQSNPFTRGTYSFDGLAQESPGAALALGTPLRGAGAPRVLFAGEATHPTLFSTVHGAADTGYREARRLLDKLDT